jgi:CMP-2-keto-3-deoxyoctulosonic acid synthetase
MTKVAVTHLETIGMDTSEDLEKAIGMYNT